MNFEVRQLYYEPSFFKLPYEFAVRLDHVLPISRSCVLFAMAALGFFPQPTTAAQEIVQQARSKINEECLSDPDMHGSVILLDSGSDGTPGAIFVVAEQKADQQLAKLKALHASLGLGQAYPVIGTAKLPHQKWLANAKKILSDVTQDSGDLIQSLYYQDVGGGLEFTLQGRLSCSLGHVPYDDQYAALEKWGKEIDQDPAFAAQALIKRNSFLYQNQPEKLGGLLSKEQSWNFLVGNNSSESLIAGLRTFDTKFVNDPKLYGGFSQAIEKLDPTGEKMIGIDLYVWPSQDSPNQSSYAQSELQEIFPNLPINLVEQKGGNWNTVLGEIEREARSSSRLDGCEVSSLCFATEWDEINKSNRIEGFYVFPVGRMGARQQWPHLDQLIKTQLLEGSENRILIKLIGITTSSLDTPTEIPVEISAFDYPTNDSGKGVLNYSAGLAQFRQSMFENAAASFKEASLNDPLKVEYRFWYALSELEQEKKDQAYAIILSAAQRFDLSSGSHGRKIATSLEKIQGPIRFELEMLKKRAIREVKTKN